MSGSDTLFCLGALYKKAHKFDQAERCYRDAIDIEKQHSGNSRTVTFRMGEYVDILRKLGRNKEADQLTTLQPDESTHGHKLSNIGQLQSEATKCEREGNVEKARELFEQAHEVAKLEAPYGTSSISTLNDLAQFFVRQKSIDRPNKSISNNLKYSIEMLIQHRAIKQIVSWPWLVFVCNGARSVMRAVGWQRPNNLMANCELAAHHVGLHILNWRSTPVLRKRPPS